VIVLLLLVLLTAGYFGVRSLLTDEDGALTASGTIEAVEVSISPEVGGKVAEVLVDEGEAVQAGDVLLRLDGSLLQAQRDLTASSLDAARAAHEAAQAQYEVVVAAALAESAANRTSSWRLTDPPDYTLPPWYFSPDEQLAAAQGEWEAAKRAYHALEQELKDLLASPTTEGFRAAEERLLAARAAFLAAEDVVDRARLASDNPELQEAAQDALDDAQAELEEAQADYDDLADSDAGQDVLEARAKLAVAQERIDSSRDRWLALQTGVQSPRVVAAWKAVGQAAAAAGQAAANLRVVETQIDKLTVVAPSAGVILSRAVQPGEVVSPGAAALTLGRLDDLTLTVYVPEDRYGEIALGQSVSVTVDSFPGETFTATVVRIADRAEFTPRNVQTVEGRKTTVYAIELQVEDPDGKLRPGMPADVTFGVER
jgi:multidrug resistance efflux pump